MRYLNAKDDTWETGTNPAFSELNLTVTYKSQENCLSSSPSITLLVLLSMLQGQTRNQVLEARGKRGK